MREFSPNRCLFPFDVATLRPLVEDPDIGPLARSLEICGRAFVKMTKHVAHPSSREIAQARAYGYDPSVPSETQPVTFERPLTDDVAEYLRGTMSSIRFLNPGITLEYLRG